MQFSKEILSNEFTKYLMDLSDEGWEYYQPLLHHFTGADKFGPHCHPWNFTIHILKGGYIEKVYHIEDNGTWHTELIPRKPGTVHQLQAECIHEIYELLEHDCWTVAVPGEGSRDWRHWRFYDTGIYSRVHYETEFKKYGE